jgi:pimeloyl-ACP methyl ester carboxylesterase
MAATLAEQSHRAEVNGAELWVEEYGAGDPIVLIHGGLCAIQMWGGAIPLLAETHRVFALDDRGHGRSTNPASKLSYEQIADDAVALVRQLELSNPVICGWSDGGEIALQIGLRHPGVARALVAGATSLELGTESTRQLLRQFFHVGNDDRVDFDAFKQQFAETLLPMMRAWHPGGDAQIEMIVRQSAEMWLSYPGLTRGELDRIVDPVLVISGDRDEHVPVEEAVRLYRSLPNAELALLPGASHMRPVFEAETFVRAVLDFVQRH